MESFSISDIYLDSENKRVVDINPLPENCCNFDCVFCPFGKTSLKTKVRQYFPETTEFINKLDKFFAENKVDKVFINPEGEALYNTELPRIIELIKSYSIKIKILSNGYIFSQDYYFNILKEFEEVIGELVVVNEKDFQKLQNPIDGLTIKNYIENLSEFSKKFEGRFILAVNILKNYNDNPEELEKIKNALNKINPDIIFIETQTEDRFNKNFAVSREKLKEIKNMFSPFPSKIKV